MQETKSPTLQLWEKLAREADFNTSKMARRMGISTRQLRRYTHQEFGVSPAKWLNSQRMELAPALLKSKRSVKMVAADLGFRQSSHFCRAFKDYHRRLPSEFIVQRWKNVRF